MYENYDTQLTMAQYKINDLRKRAEMDQKADMARSANPVRRSRLNFHWAGLGSKSDSKTAGNNN